ncbi:MAG: TolC family protein [Bdellovibrio sp.]
MRFAILFSLLFAHNTRGSTSTASHNSPEKKYSEVLSFPDSVSKALRQNPDLLKIRTQAESMRIRAELALAPNNPQIFYNKHNAAELSAGSRGASDEIGVSFQVNFPGKSILNSQSLEAQARGGIAQAKLKELEVILRLGQSFLNFDVSVRALEMIDSSLSRSQMLLEILQKKFVVGNATQVDLMSLKAQRAELELEKIVRQHQLEQSLLNFRSLIQEPDSAFVPERTSILEFLPIPYSIEKMYQIALKNNLDLKATESFAKSSQLMVSATRLEAFPDFTFSAGIQAYNEPNAQAIPGVNRDFNFGISTSIPLFFPWSEWSKLQANKKDALSWDYEYQKKKLEIRTLITRLVGEYETHRSQLKSMIENIIPLNRASYEISLRTYSIGKSDYLRLKDAHESYLEALKRVLEMELTTAQSQQDLLLAVGCDFLRRSPVYVCQEE